MNTVRGFTDDYLKALARQMKARAEDLQACSDDAKKAAAACRAELRRRAQLRKAEAK